MHDHLRALCNKEQTQSGITLSILTNQFHGNIGKHVGQIVFISSLQIVLGNIINRIDKFM